MRHGQAVSPVVLSGRLNSAAVSADQDCNVHFVRKEFRVSVGWVVMLIGVGAAAIALWIDVRFPGIAPRALRGFVIHAALAIGAGQLLVPTAMNALLGAESPVLALVAIFGVAFPALLYAFLVGVWTIKTAQGFLLR
jgi:hypothetical protein